LNKEGIIKRFQIKSGSFPKAQWMVEKSLIIKTNQTTAQTLSVIRKIISEKEKVKKNLSIN
jgi:hypothetical protein